MKYWSLLHIRLILSYSFNVGIAQLYGVNEAIFLNNIKFWILQNEVSNINFKDGYYWTYGTAKRYKRLFPFWTERQIRYIAESLKKRGVLKIGNYNKLKYDRTFWYTITDKSLLQKCNMEVTKMEHQSDENVTPIPDINTDINTDNSLCDSENTESREELKTKIEQEIIAVKKDPDALTVYKSVADIFRFSYKYFFETEYRNLLDSKGIGFRKDIKNLRDLIKKYNAEKAVTMIIYFLDKWEGFKTDVIKIPTFDFLAKNSEKINVLMGNYIPFREKQLGEW